MKGSEDKRPGEASWEGHAIVRQEMVKFLMMAVAMDAGQRRPVGGKIMTSLGYVIAPAERHQKNSSTTSYILLDIN